MDKWTSALPCSSSDFYSDGTLAHTCLVQSGGVIAGIVVGGDVAVVIIIAIAVYLTRSKRVSSGGAKLVEG